ncbi:MAG: Coenzyme F420 hydrogenase/dehydrogenase, beta subunit C-terminal domain [Ruminococcus sp.]|nr:Coenzyme F420 hydrogenase/dehydrogenase, beta subunit C-terminal domain [Ruminococcus sp.]
MENHYLCNPENCTGCGSCANACPQASITMQENSEGFLYPVTNFEQCIQCGKCGKACHVISDVEKREGTFYMCWNNDRKILEQSSSGGTFSALAMTVINRNGVVYGAYQDQENNCVYHTSVRSAEKLNKLRLSKYSQSDMKTVCREICELLKNDTPVLFCGTACQVAGLLSYLSLSSAQTKLGLLYTVDVLCHGVASQKTVNAFLKSKERLARKKIKRYYFRVKDRSVGWKSGGGTRMRLIYDDDTVFVAPMGADTFFLGFNNNLFLRESCYRCKYCGTNRISDFTIADYWGVPEETLPEGQTQFGVSVMTVNTDKAASYLPILHGLMHIEKIKPDIAVANNRAFKKPNDRPDERDAFFRMLDHYDYDALIRKLLWKPYWKGMIKGVVGAETIIKIKRIIKRK